MGFKMEKYGPLLDSLAVHLEDAGLVTVTVQAAVAWAVLPQDAHPHRWKQRLDAARGFARYLAASDPAAEVPPAGLLAARPNRHQHTSSPGKRSPRCSRWPGSTAGTCPPSPIPSFSG